MIFWRKIVIFHTKYPKNFRASLCIWKKSDFFGVKSWFFTRNTPKFFAPPSARRNFLKCAPPPLTWNPGSAPDNVYGSSYYWNFRTSSFKQVACLILKQICFYQSQIVYQTRYSMICSSFHTMIFLHSKECSPISLVMSYSLICMTINKYLVGNKTIK